MYISSTVKQQQFPDDKNKEPEKIQVGVISQLQKQGV